MKLESFSTHRLNSRPVHIYEIGAMNRSKLLFSIFLGAIALGVGLWLGQAVLSSAKVEPQLEIAGIYLPEARRIEDFTLIHQTGEPFKRDDLKGRWTFVFFGYTYCPDVCPMALAHMNMMAKQLTEQEAEHDTSFMLISVDPERDTPERLGEYTAYFNEKFSGATGTPEELTRLAQQVGVVFFVPDHEPGENYLVDHSATIALFDPDGRLHALFTPPHDPEVMTSDFIAIRERFQAAL